MMSCLFNAIDLLLHSRAVTIGVVTTKKITSFFYIPLLPQECCEPYHTGQAKPPTVEAALRARFCAFVKGKEEYIVSTFHPQYHCFKYGVDTPGGALKQLEGDVAYAVNKYSFLKLKVLSVEPGSNDDEQFITFSYQSVGKVCACTCAHLMHACMGCVPVDRCACTCGGGLLQPRRVHDALRHEMPCHAA